MREVDADGSERGLARLAGRVGVHRERRLRAQANIAGRRGGEVPHRVAAIRRDLGERDACGHERRHERVTRVV